MVASRMALSSSKSGTFSSRLRLRSMFSTTRQQLWYPWPARTLPKRYTRGGLARSSSKASTKKKNRLPSSSRCNFDPCAGAFASASTFTPSHAPPCNHSRSWALLLTSEMVSTSSRLMEASFFTPAASRFTTLTLEASSSGSFFTRTDVADSPGSCFTTTAGAGFLSKGSSAPSPSSRFRFGGVILSTSGRLGGDSPDALPGPLNALNACISLSRLFSLTVITSTGSAAPDLSSAAMFSLSLTCIFSSFTAFSPSQISLPLSV
mmetsp:Transcript_108511/g.306855  ORF Transcript_108511/g.306855 Transcript_108511/m.306855 type:complete len:263 (-) Transcript_108511:271-1059(-)